MDGKPTIYTIGHSTHSDVEFVRILKAYEIGRLADVRTIPRSRHNPQFNKDELEGVLKKHGIEYLHIKELGGLRHARPDSPNTGWRNLSFRGYADYMQTSDFSSALESLIGLAAEKSTAIMCAEAVPWRCHRSLIADALLVRGIEVIDVFGPTSSKIHALNPMAQVRGGRIVYPEPEK